MPTLQRARRRLRPRRARHPRGARRRRVGGRRPEGVDVDGTRGPLGHPGHPHPSRPAQAPRHDVLRVRHDRPRRRGPTAAPGHRRGRVQRGLPHRRAHPRRAPPRRNRRRVERRAHHADERTRGDRRRRVPARGRHDRHRRRHLARASRTAHRRPARPAPSAVGRGRGGPADLGTAAAAPGGGRPGSGGFRGQARLRAPEPGDLRPGGRPARRGGSAARRVDDAAPGLGGLHHPLARLPIPARQGQLDRGRHLGDPAQRDRRARPGPAVRDSRRQGRRVEGPPR